MKKAYAQQVVESYVTHCPDCGSEFTFESDLVGDEVSIEMTCDRCATIYEIRLDMDQF